MKLAYGVEAPRPQDDPCPTCGRGGASGPPRSFVGRLAERTRSSVGLALAWGLPLGALAWILVRRLRRPESREPVPPGDV